MEVERQVHPASRAPVVGHQPLERQVDLADQHARGIGVDHAAHLAQHLEDLGLVRGVHLEQALDGRVPGPDRGIGRVVAPPRVLHEVPQHVDAKAVDAAVEPEAQHAVHRGAHRGVAPVEVGLLLQEGVVVVLAGALVERPGAAAEVAQPVVGRAAAGRRIAPEVPVAPRVVARGAAFAEPGMLRRGVVGHEVEDQLHAARVQVGEQRVEVGERAELRRDAAVVGDVVAAVLHGGGKDGRQPHGIHAEPLQVIEPAAQAGQVALAIAVRVLERQRVDLVHDRLAMPHARAFATGMPDFFRPRRVHRRHPLKRSPQ